MNDVLAVTTVVLEKKQPEGGLGNLLADAMRLKATEKFAMQVDAAFINNGGVRLPALSVGNITRGKVFEVAPFDNLIILQKLTGVQVQAFLDYVAGRGGWPSSGIRFQIKDKKAINIEIGGKPLDLSAEYTIANNDYVINGGDDCVELKNIPQINKGYVFRDAVIEYLQQITLLGKKISNTIENRVSYAQ
jgi:2',3'-cyclic-nucleotide 2'-phosphodiesterase (5'-nucleotidase family)